MTLIDVKPTFSNIIVSIKNIYFYLFYKMIIFFSLLYIPVRRRHQKRTDEYCPMVTLKYYYYSLSKRFVFFFFSFANLFTSYSQGLHKFINDRSPIILPQFNTYSLFKPMTEVHTYPLYVLWFGNTLPRWQQMSRKYFFCTIYDYFG